MLKASALDPTSWHLLCLGDTADVIYHFGLREPGLPPTFTS